MAVVFCVCGHPDYWHMKRNAACEFTGPEKYACDCPRFKKATPEQRKTALRSIRERSK